MLLPSHERFLYFRCFCTQKVKSPCVWVDERVVTFANVSPAYCHSHPVKKKILNGFNDSTSENSQFFRQYKWISIIIFSGFCKCYGWIFTVLEQFVRIAMLKGLGSSKSKTISRPLERLQILLALHSGFEIFRYCVPPDSCL